MLRIGLSIGAARLVHDSCVGSPVSPFVVLGPET